MMDDFYSLTLDQLEEIEKKILKPHEEKDCTSDSIESSLNANESEESCDDIIKDTLLDTLNKKMKKKVKKPIDKKQEEIKKNIIIEEITDMKKLSFLMNITCDEIPEYEKTKENGNCLFDTIKKYNFGIFKGCDEKQIRSFVVDYVNNDHIPINWYIENPKDENYVSESEYTCKEAWCKVMAKNGTYGDYVAIKALTSMLNIGIYIFTQSMASDKFDNFDEPDKLINQNILYFRCTSLKRKSIFIRLRKKHFTPITR